MMWRKRIWFEDPKRVVWQKVRNQWTGDWVTITGSSLWIWVIDTDDLKVAISTDWADTGSTVLTYERVS